MTLREQQEALVRALVAGGPVPPGFDPDEVAAAGAVCRHKRDAHAGHAEGVGSERRPRDRARRGR
ncbi:hypothetical protein [Tsukamurella sp. 1534]|uniref:hypothetical protein n=1 Tax=Tsukamurella sp. 1534 TaxID=1151061 RepID=UPI0002E2AA1A|nr:hypothetical protein [Tsukamurella sp. 1534]